MLYYEHVYEYNMCLKHKFLFYIRTYIFYKKYVLSIHFCIFDLKKLISLVSHKEKLKGNGRLDLHYRSAFQFDKRLCQIYVLIDN